MENDDDIAGGFGDREVEEGRWVERLLKYPGNIPELDRRPGKYPRHRSCNWHAILWNVKKKMWKIPQVFVAWQIGNCFNFGQGNGGREQGRGNTGEKRR